MVSEFETWWYHEGSGPPTAGNDMEEHCKRMCKIAWEKSAEAERERIKAANVQEIEKVNAHIAALEKNSARYLHMRNSAQFQSRNGPGLYWYLPRFRDGKVRDEGQQLDDAIDAAIRARSQP